MPAAKPHPLVSCGDVDGVGGDAEATRLAMPGLRLAPILGSPSTTCPRRFATLISYNFYNEMGLLLRVGRRSTTPPLLRPLQTKPWGWGGSHGSHSRQAPFPNLRRRPRPRSRFARTARLAPRDQLQPSHERRGRLRLFLFLMPWCCSPPGASAASPWAFPPFLLLRLLSTFSIFASSGHPASSEPLPGRLEGISARPAEAGR